MDQPLSSSNTEGFAISMGTGLPAGPGSMGSAFPHPNPIFPHATTRFSKPFCSWLLFSLAEEQKAKGRRFGNAGWVFLAGQVSWRVNHQLQGSKEGTLSSHIDHP